jgi:hypothetical protein
MSVDVSWSVIYGGAAIDEFHDRSPEKFFGGVKFFERYISTE